MLREISKQLREVLSQFPAEDQIIFNNKLIEINTSNYQSITAASGQKTMAFVDGGQAEIVSAGNFCLSFIRVCAVTFKDNQKINLQKKEFYLLTTAEYGEEELWYKSRIFGDKLIAEEDLLISSNDSTIRTGLERAPIAKVANVARRLTELSVAASLTTDFIVLDGTLEPTFLKEEKYLSRLSDNTCALAKSCALFTVSGNSPVVLLNKLSPNSCWSYFLEGNTFLVKLNEKARHVFRFAGNREALPYLINNSTDALFLGYPYGLIWADKTARVSGEEKNSLKMNFLLREENREIKEYLTTANAHEILDGLG